VQVARLLREEIISGAIPLGAMMPSEKALVQRFSISRATTQTAFRLLREEGLIVTRQGQGSFVATVPRVSTVRLEPGDQVRARMPNEDERTELGLAAGIPILVVRRRDGREEKHGAAAAVCQCQDDESLLPA
jgi:DNA-binding GntR family transcriptional regulator